MDPAKFTSAELKVFQCFINPRYPACKRSLLAVCKETELDSDAVLEVLTKYTGDFFADLGDGWWIFNFNGFVRRYAVALPQLFLKYHVQVKPLGLIVVPKSMPLEILETLIKGLSANLPHGLGLVVNSVARELVKGLPQAIAKAQEATDIAKAEAEAAEDPWLDEDPADDLKDRKSTILSFAM